MMHSLTAHMMAAYPPDIYMRPHVTPFGMMEFWRVKEIIEHGDADKERFKHALTEKLEAFTAAQQRTLSTIRPIAPRQVQK
jgi:NTE family protein